MKENLMVLGHFRVSALRMLTLFMTLLGSIASVTEAAADSAPIIGSPDQCTVEPRPDAFFNQFPATVELVLPTPDATPSHTYATPPSGRPADAETEDAVVALLTEVSACLNAGEIRRLLTLWTDDWAGRQVAFVGSAPFLEEHEPLLEEARQGFRLLETIILVDGRVGAIIELDDGPGGFLHPLRTFLFLEETDNGLRIDGALPLAPAQATPGSGS